MAMNMTRLVKDLDKTMITEPGETVKFVITYKMPTAMIGRSKLMRRKRTLKYAITAVITLNNGGEGLLDCLSGSGYEINYFM
jgi:hypothetical protein